jgi:hypothetical protein
LFPLRFSHGSQIYHVINFFWPAGKIYRPVTAVVKLMTRAKAQRTPRKISLRAWRLGAINSVEVVSFPLLEDLFQISAVFV